MFQPLYMGTNHVLGVDNYVPLTTNNFEIKIFNTGANSGGVSGPMKTLTLSTAEIGEIAEEQDVITVHYGNGQIKFPSKVSFSDVDWTLNCYATPDTLGSLIDWRKEVYNPDTELMGLPTQYMRTAYFIRYTGNGQLAYALKAPGVWCRSLKYGAMNQEGGQIVQVSVTLVISKAIYMSARDMSVTGVTEGSLT